MIRRAMVRMPAAIEDMNAKMLLQVHDELIFEVAKDEARALAPVLPERIHALGLPPSGGPS